MKKIITLTLFLSFQFVFSQNKFLDFIVTHKNDTVFGRYRFNKLIDLNKKSHKINREKVKTIRFQDRIYHLTNLKEKDFFSDKNDSIIGLHEYTKSVFKKEHSYYVYKLPKNQRRDYLILKEKDTLYGQIKTTSIGFKQFISDSNEKHSLNSGSYREKGSRYCHKNNLRIKGDYLTSLKLVKLLYDSNNIKLFQQDGYNYYIEKNGSLEYILPNRFSRIIQRIMPENKKLLKKIKDREYTYYDVYLVVKYYNEAN